MSTSSEAGVQYVKGLFEAHSGLAYMGPFKDYISMVGRAGLAITN